MSFTGSVLVSRKKGRKCVLFPPSLLAGIYALQIAKGETDAEPPCLCLG